MFKVFKFLSFPIAYDRDFAPNYPIEFDLYVFLINKYLNL